MIETRDDDADQAPVLIVEEGGITATCSVLTRRVSRVRSALAAGRRGALGGYLTDEEPLEVVFYCPECAEREFGPD